MCTCQKGYKLSVFGIICLTILFFQLGQLPSVLYLQMDNCWRECKNKYILGFLSVLVEIGIFKKVRCVCQWHTYITSFLTRSSIDICNLKLMNLLLTILFALRQNMTWCQLFFIIYKIQNGGIQKFRSISAMHFKYTFNRNTIDTSLNEMYNSC